MLDIVQKNGDVRKVINEGADFEMIGNLTTYALAEGFLEFENNRLIVTQKGITKIELEKKEYKKTNKEEWIKPDLKNKVSKIDKNDIFLPSQDELTF